MQAKAAQKAEKQNYPLGGQRRMTGRQIEEAQEAEEAAAPAVLDDPNADDGDDID